MATLTVSDTTPRVQYTATASQTTFAYTFAIFEDADLKVYQTASGVDPDDTADLLTLTTHYTVTGAGGSSGGNVVLVTGATVGDVITIERDLAVARTTDYANLGDLASESFNDDLDKLVMMVQQNESDISAKIPSLPSNTQKTGAFTIEEPVAGQVLVFDADGNIKNGGDESGLTNTASPNLLSEDTLTADATTYDVSVDMNTHKSYVIEIEHVPDPSTDTTVSMTVNNDHTATNYYSLEKTDDGTTIASSLNNNAVIGTTDASSRGFIRIHVSYGSALFVIAHSTCNYGVGSQLRQYHYTWSKTSAVSTNVGQFRFTADQTDGLQTGTKIRVYRGDL